MLFESQKLVYNALSNNSTFMNLVSNRLYDEPQTNEVYPYVIIGGGTSVPYLRHGKDGIDESFLITIFTKPGGLGWYPCKKIAQSIRSVLHLKKFSVNSTYNNVICIEESENREKNGDYRNMDLTYKIIIEEV